MSFVSIRDKTLQTTLQWLKQNINQSLKSQKAFHISSLKVIYKMSILRIPDSKVDGAYMGPTWGRQAPGGPHVGAMNLAVRDFGGNSLCYNGTL